VAFKVSYRNFYKEMCACCGMKKWCVVLVFLLLFGFASAMEGPIKVMAQQKNRVSVIIRNTEKMTMNSDMGVVDEDGVFAAKTFFSLVPPYNVRLIITDPSGGFIDFDQDVDSGFTYGMEIDCRSGNCIVSASEVPLDTGDQTGQAAVVVNDSVVEPVVEEIIEEVVVEEVVVEEVGAESGGVMLTGKALFFEDDGSVNWIYSGGGSVVLLLLLVFIVVMFRRGGSAKKEVLDEDEKELEEMEKKVKDTGEKIKKVKDGKERRAKIYKAKLKLVDEERELSELLESGRSSPARVEEQKKDVEEAAEKVEEVVEKVVEKVEGDGEVK